MFSAFTREWLETDVAVFGGVIAGLGEYDGGERVDAGGQYLVPGFIDAHVHIESSKLVPAEFARAVVPHGTTAVVTDPHEMANVLGREGVRVDARGVRGPAARRVRDGAVVRAGERLRVARLPRSSPPTWRRSCAIRARSAWPR